MIHHRKKLIIPFILSVVSLCCFISPSIALGAAEDKGKAQEGGATSGEVSCEASVFYSWKRAPRTQKSSEPSRPPTGTPPPPAEDEKPIEMFYTRIGESGSPEVDVKNRLASRLSATEGEAIKSCQNEHEGEATCVADQLKRMGEDYRNLDFPARHALLSSLTEDCRLQAGVCLSARSSQIACAQIQTPGHSAAEDAKGASGKKK